MKEKIVKRSTRGISFEDSVKRVKKIAKEYGITKGPTELSRELGISKQRVQQIASTLRKRGIKIPHIRWKLGSSIDEAVKELKKEK